MNTKYDIDDVIYVPAKVEKVTKTSDGRVFYILRTVDGGYEINATEEKIDEEFVRVIPNNCTFIKGDKTYKPYDMLMKICKDVIKGGCAFKCEILK